MSKIPGDPGYRAGWCIHYVAPRHGGDVCEAGVRFGRWSGVPHDRRPCYLDAEGKSKAGAETCECLRRPTPEEIAAHAEWSRGRIELMSKVMVAIRPWRDKHKGKSAAEVIECPACKGRLHLGIAARNGHVHAHCETEGCVSWME